MKKILIGTTALVAAGMITGSASAAEAMKVGVSGYQHVYLIYGSQNDATGEAAQNARNHGIQKEGEVHFKASTTMDNGIKVGFEAEMEAEAGTQDENFVWFEGGFGRVTVGAYWGPSLLMSHNAPGAAPSWGNFGNMNPATTPANSTITNFGANSYQVLTFKDNKIAYYTPTIGPGIKIGVAYTPDLDEGKNNNGGFTTNAGDDKGVAYEASIELKTKVGGGSLGMNANYAKAKQETDTAGKDDRVAWGLGFDISMGAFTVGGGYTTDDEGVTGDSNEKQFTIGGAYSTGPWKVALIYGNGEDENGGGGVADEITMMQMSAAYSWGPGVTLAAGIQSQDYQDGGKVAADANKATVAFIGTALSF